jgi:ketosteroid isomerase-like protein
MSDAVNVLKEFNDALFGDGEIRRDLLDPDVVVIDHDIPDAREYHGHQGFEKWILGDWASARESYTLEQEKFIDGPGDLVISVFTVTARGKGSGIEIQARNAAVNTVRDGRIVRVEYFTTEQEALEAVGLAETRDR